MLRNLLICYFMLFLRYMIDSGARFILQPKPDFVNSTSSYLLQQFACNGGPTSLIPMFYRYFQTYFDINVILVATLCNFPCLFAVFAHKNSCFSISISYYNNISQQEVIKKKMNLDQVALFKDQITELSLQFPGILQKTSKMHIQASCPFYLPASHIELDELSDNCQLMFELCISGEWIFQREMSSKSIISAFRCDYDKSFEIIRRYEGSGNQEKILSGLRFVFRVQRRVTLDFFISQNNCSQLQSFTKILQTKAIFQVGFFQNYRPIKRLGSGTTSIVYSVRRLDDGKTYAVKCSKRRMNNDSLRDDARMNFINEISIWNRLVHQNIAKLHNVYESQNPVYMVTELLPLSLSAFIKKYGFPNKRMSWKIIRQLLSAIQYLHDQGIMHRDIKLQNIMIKKDEMNRSEVTPILVDFGLAYCFCRSQSSLVRCGTPGYTAPEILNLDSNEPEMRYSQICDIFSLGVVAYLLLFKKFPFQGESIEQILRKNQECSILLESDNLSNISVMEMDFLSKILRKDPLERMTAKQALKHQLLTSQLAPTKSEQQFRNSKPTEVQLTYNQ